MLPEENNNLLDVFAKIGVTLGTIRDTITEDTNRRAKLEAKRAVQPVFYRVTQSVVVANGIGILRMTGPDEGHIWYLRSLTLGGLTVGTVAAGTADLFITAMDIRQLTTLAMMGLADWRDHFAALPVISTFYARGAMPLRFNEEAYIFFSGATNGQQYVGSVQAEDFEEAAVRQEWAV